MTLRRLLRIGHQRLRSIARPAELDAETQTELAFHFDQLVAEMVAEGLTEDQARAAARRALGNVTLVEEQCRDERRLNWFNDLRQDIGYGLRMLRKYPVFTTVAVLSLALGIGSNTAVLGVMNAVLVDDLPLPNADRLVFIRAVPLDNPSQTSGVSLSDFVAWRDRSRAFEAMDASISGPRDLTAEGADELPERITGQSVSTGWFSTLGVQAMHGRVFSEADDQPGSPAIVISHRLWQSRFAGDSQILNRQVRIDGAVKTIVGVMSQDFRFHDPRVDCWMPLFIGARQAPGTGRFFGVTARLKPGITVDRAQADLSAIAAQLANEFPERNKGWGVQVRSLREALFGWTREPLVTLWAAVALVLLISCANVAGLLIARASIRRREIALRAAVGAGRGRIVRQLLTESVLLSLAGGACGLLVAWCGVHGLVAMTPPIGLPRIGEMGLNLRILGMTGLLSVLTGILFGLAPALVVSQLNPMSPLKDPDATLPARDRQLGRTVLVAAQLALALVLLIGSGLLTKSFLRLTGRDLNFQPAGLLTFEFRAFAGQRPLGQYRGYSYFEMVAPPSQTMKKVLERLRALPGVESVGGSSFVPVDSLIVPVMDVILDGSPASQSPRDRDALRAAYFLVTPRFFETMRTPLLRGREFAESDTATRPWVAIVNEAAARRFWPGEDPIGRRLTLDVVPEEQSREVIAVVKDIPTRHGQIDPQPVIYASYLQQPLRYRGPWGSMFGQMTFLVRHSSDPLSLVPSVRRAVAEIEPDRPLAAILTADQRLRFGTDKIRYRVFLITVLACTASILAAVGIYGTLAYAVSQRAREIGIRKALGASTQEIVLLVGRSVLPLLLSGLGFGWAGALALTRLIEAQLWGITPTDPATFAAVSLFMVLVAFLACVGPTRQAVAVDPIVALRRE